VADDQTFASVLAREHWPGLTVRNRAVMGYGTTQAMQTLERDLARGARPALVLYGWMFFHATRSGRRASQLEKNALKRAPWFEVEGGQLVFKGQAGPEDAVPDTPEDPSKAEWAISRAALRRMRDDVARQGSRFVVLIFPSLSWDGSHRAAARRLRLMLDEDGIAYLDVANDPEFGNEDALYYEGDWHPRAEWHRRLAAAIARGLTSPTTQAATRVACLPR
jgi:hypothetical protein